MASKKRGASIRQIADQVALPADVVRNVLKELPGVPLPRDAQDKIFKAARQLGYDFRKLKIGKRMQYRKETLHEIIDKIEAHPHWGRADIVRYLITSLGLVERVHRRVFKEEFGGDEA